jgi:hypothetical protein
LQTHNDLLDFGRHFGGADPGWVGGEMRAAKKTKGWLAGERNLGWRGCCNLRGTTKKTQILTYLSIQNTRDFSVK